jgi:hypothetical protein
MEVQRWGFLKSLSGLLQFGDYDSEFFPFFDRS